MEKKSKGKYIDVDGTILEPSPQRIRNILTLEERIRAIQAYDCRPMYTKVAKMFNCSWEQIKNIIANRDAIMEFYDATKNTHRHNDPNRDEQRQRKIAFLGECMYEYIQRIQFHTKADLTEELIRSKAFEFRDVIQIENFTPNKTWLNHFKATYNFSLSNRQITLTRTPPASLDLKDIMTYCIKNKSKKVPAHIRPLKNLYRTTTKIAISTANDAALEELKQRRERKIKFLEKALYEYIQRAQYHHKMPLNEDMLRRVAYDLKDMLKIDNFFPNKAWFSNFRTRFEFDLTQIIVCTRTPLLSLDLRDILSYCSRVENKNLTSSTVTLAPKQPATIVATGDISAPAKSPLNTTQIINYRVLSHDTTQTNIMGGEIKEVKQEIIDLEDDDSDVKPNLSELRHTIEESQECQPPPLKIQKIETVGEVHSPGHWSENSDNDAEELPKQVRSYVDALKLLKPLEEFAMLEENYRVIGLISQLEEIFKNPPVKDEDDDDDGDDNDTNCRQ